MLTVWHFQHEFAAGRPHGQSCVYGGTPQQVSCDPRGHDSDTPVSIQPAPSPPNSWEPTRRGAICVCATCPESFERRQSLRGHPDPNWPDSHQPRLCHGDLHFQVVLYRRLILRRLSILGRHLVYPFRILLSISRKATKKYLPAGWQLGLEHHQCNFFHDWNHTPHCRYEYQHPIYVSRLLSLPG